MGADKAIIGANSQLGRMLRMQYSGQQDIRWFSRSGPEYAWEVAHGSDSLRRSLGDIGLVLCLAGATPGGDGDFSLNTAVAEAVMKAAEPGSRVFLASSLAVYSGAIGHSESDIVVPAGAYGRSKLEMEQRAAEIAKERGVHLVCLRFGNVVGADLLFRNVRAGRTIEIDEFPNGTTPKRSYLDPEFMASGLQTLFALAKRGITLPATLNFAADPPLEMGDLMEAAGVPFTRRAAASGASAEVSMDMTRLKALDSGFTQLRDARTAIRAWRRVCGAS